MIWGFCVYFVYMIPLETDVLRKHRFQKRRLSDTIYMTARNLILTVPRRYFFCGSFMFLFCLVFAMFCARLFICALWSPAGKGLTSWLSFVVSTVSLSLSHWYPGSGVVLNCIDPDLCTLTYTKRNLLEKETEDILKEFGLGHIVDINFQVLTGYLVDVPRQANQRMRIALGKFITSKGRFKADRQ